jgi:hypothetical protein
MTTASNGNGALRRNSHHEQLSWPTTQVKRTTLKSTVSSESNSVSARLNGERVAFLVEDSLKLRLRVNLPELALAGLLAAFAAVAVRGGDSGAGREAGLAEFLQTNPNFPRNPMGDFLQYFCERYNFAKTQTL